MRRQKKDEEDAGKLRRDRAAVMVLVGLTMVAVAAYVAVVVGAARDLRTRAALERNGSMAQLGAQVLDQQWDSALYVLGALSKQPPLAERGDLRKVAAGQLRAPLQEAVELVPDLEGAALYDSEGRLIQQYPQDSVFAKSAHEAVWFQNVVARRSPTIGEVLRLPDKERSEVFTIALPVGNGPKSGGYLLALYRLGDIYGWLRRVPMAGGAVYLSDSSGQVIAAGASRIAPYAGLPLRLPREIGNGNSARLMTDPVSRERLVVGYARTRNNGWSLMVVQPAGDALGPTDAFLVRILLVAAPLLLLIPVAAYGLVILYQRQHVLARELTARNEQLRLADRAKSDLLANVSHDLKTPIAGMQLSIADFLECDYPAGDREDLGDRLRECLGLVRDELERLSARVRNLLDMTRLDAGAAAAMREPCDLTDVIAGALERQRPLLRDRKLTADFPPEPLLVFCDPNQAETVALNLLENAIKYSPMGSPLHLRGKRENGFAVVSISDKGPGVRPEDRERIFEKFVQAGERGSGGTGLGLAICKAIVESEGGWIRVGEAIGGGAEFQFGIPLIEEV